MATIEEALAMAVQYQQAGYLAAAEQTCQQVLAVNPNEASAWHLLGVVNVQLGRADAAVDCLHRALAIYPDWAEAHFHLGKILSGEKRFDEAEASLRRACQLKPDLAEAHDELGLVFQRQKKPDEAVACHRRALEANPNYAVANNDLGVALETQGKSEEAEVCYRRALELRPTYAAALNNLGNICKKLGKLDEAITCFRRALETIPDSPFVRCGLGNVLGLTGRLDEAAVCFRRALELKPDFVTARSTLLCMMQYHDSMTPRQLAEAHAEFGRIHAAPLRSTWSRHDNVRDPERPIRLGFFSSDLRRHPVGYFLVRPLENLDPHCCETFLYSDGTMQDDLTDRLRAAATIWSNAFGWSDDRLAEQIRSDRIDVLFDLAGHTSGNRIILFARKPAPIQITWLGYEGTTGVEAIDYLLADRFVIPPQSEKYYGERVLRMPDDYVCYDPPDDAPPVSPLPAMAKGFVTFAGFHNPSKLSPRMVEVWSRVLNRVPGGAVVVEVLFDGRRGGRGPAVGDVRRPRHRRRAAGIRSTERARRVSGGLRADGHRSGHASVCGGHYHVRRALDGHAGRDLPRPDVCRASRVEPFDQCRPDGDHRRGHGRVRRVGGFAGRRPAAAGRLACRPARAGGRFAAVRREAVRRQLRRDPPRRLAEMV